MRNSPPPELDYVAEKVGQFIEYWGFKSIEGKIWAHIFLSKTPLCPQDLCQRLSISKALVSLSIKRLLDFNVIHPSEHKSSHGRMYYETNPDLMSVILNVLRSRERTMLGEIASAARTLRAMPKKESEKHAISENRAIYLDQVCEIASAILGRVCHNEESFLNEIGFKNAPDP